MDNPSLFPCEQLEPPEPPAHEVDSGAVQLSTREISRFVSYFEKHIRRQSLQEKAGVFRMIQRLLAGNTRKMQRPLLPQEIADALKHYAADPFVQASDQRTRKNIRSFFTYDNILQWQKPVPPKPTARRPQDVTLTELASLGRREAAPIAPPPSTIATDDQEEFEGF